MKSGTGQGTVEKVRDGLGDPWVVRDGLGHYRGGLGQFGRPSGRSGMGRRTHG